MFKTKLKNFIKITSLLLLVIFIFIISVITYVRFIDINQIKNIDGLHDSQVIIILGASIKDDKPSDALKDRLDTGIDLYQKFHLAPKILITGDDGRMRSNEIKVMTEYLQQKGILSKNILVDYHGYRTYESCRRAKQEFDINSAIIITQEFHLPRAIYLCEQWGIESQGFVADRHVYMKANYFLYRDLLASFKAWLDINILHPKSPIKY